MQPAFTRRQMAYSIDSMRVAAGQYQAHSNTRHAIRWQEPKHMIVHDH